jgi:hypothetical protein
MAQLVITVHGIRTFGNWQERLEALLKDAPTLDDDIEVYHYKYGYFSALVFIFPPTRWVVTRRFRKELQLMVRGGHRETYRPRRP